MRELDAFVIVRNRMNDIINSMQMMLEGGVSRLTPIEFSIFSRLAESLGSPVAIDELMQAGAGARTRGGEFTKACFWVHLHRMKDKLEASHSVKRCSGGAYVMVEKGE